MRDEVVAELLPGEEVPQRQFRFPAGGRIPGRPGKQSPGTAVEACHLQQHQQVPAAQEGGRPGNDAAPLGAGAGIFQAAAVAAHRHAHLGVLRLHAELREEPQERGVGAFVVDDETRVHAEVRAALLPHVVGVGMPAQPGVRLE
ncbi:hypothetical protein D9M72_458440 [compost metagenome]